MDFSYRNNDEIKPTPGIGEVLLKAIGSPLHDHLKDENYGERFIHDLQDRLQSLPLFNIDVFYSLKYFN